MEVVTMRELLEAGVHFGHQTKRWNPKMKKYIFTARNGIHVIDLQQSMKLIRKAYAFVKETVKRGGTVLFVGTKKQAQEAIEAEAKRCSMPFVHHRWLGGTLTNNVTLRQSIYKLKQLSRLVEEGTLELLSNKEASRKKKDLAKLNYYLDGIKDMHVLPSIVFVVDTKKEQLAVDEANRLNIPIIGIVDTNADPTEVQYPIPANDDAIRAIRLICSVISRAVLDGKAERQAESGEAQVTDIETELQASLAVSGSIDVSEETAVEDLSEEKVEA